MLHFNQTLTSLQRRLFVVGTIIVAVPILVFFLSGEGQKEETERTTQLTSSRSQNTDLSENSFQESEPKDTINIEPEMRSHTTESVSIGENDLTALKSQGTTQPISDKSNDNTYIKQRQFLDPLMWGMYVGWEKVDVRRSETLTVYKPDLYATSIHWGNERDFPLYLSSYIANPDRSILVIFWNPSNYLYASDEALQEAFSYSTIVEGMWDTYIDAFLGAAEEYPGEVILIPFEEANLEDSPWSCGADRGCQSEYIRAFQYLSDKIRPLEGVRVAWVMNHVSVPNNANNAVENYYPGDAFVDVVGVNGFNFGAPYADFNAIFSDALTTITQYDKPHYIFSTASGGTPEEKIDWITSMRESVWLRHPQLRGWIWFNEDKERDWRITDDPELLKVFNSLILRSIDRN